MEQIYEGNHISGGRSRIGLESFNEGTRHPPGDSGRKSLFKVDNHNIAKPTYLCNLKTENLSLTYNPHGCPNFNNHLLGHPVIGIRNTKEQLNLIAYLDKNLSLRLGGIHYLKGHAPEVLSLRKENLPLAKSFVRILLYNQPKFFNLNSGIPPNRGSNKTNLIFKQLDAYKQMFGSSF